MQYYSRDETLYLIHHGIKGQKWGIRRFQNYDGTLIKNGVSSIKDSVSNTIEGIKKKKKELHTKKLEKIKNSGDSKKIYKHVSEFSAKDLNDAMAKINAVDALKKKITETNRQKSMATFDKISEVSKKLGTIGDFFNKTSTTIDNFKKLKKSLGINNDDKESRKKKIIFSNDPELIIKNRNLLTPNEYMQALSVANTTRKLKAMTDEKTIKPDNNSENTKKNDSAHTVKEQKRTVKKRSETPKVREKVSELIEREARDKEWADFKSNYDRYKKAEDKAKKTAAKIAAKELRNNVAISKKTQKRRENIINTLRDTNKYMSDSDIDKYYNWPDGTASTFKRKRK